MTNSLENLAENSTHCHQIELPIKLKTGSENLVSEIYGVLQDHSERLKKLQSDLEYLSQGNAEIFNMVYEQQQLNSIEKIEATKQEVITLSQGIAALGQGVFKIYKRLEEDNIGELKSGQQSIQKAIEANSQKKNTANIGYLDWKQIASIITATAMVSSLCSLAVFQMAANWKIDRTPTPTEKPLKPKKTTK